MSIDAENTAQLRNLRSCSSSLLIIAGVLIHKPEVSISLIAVGLILAGVVIKFYNMIMFFRSNPFD